MTLPQRHPMDKKSPSRAVETLFAWSKPASPLTPCLGNGEPLLHAKRVKAAGELAIGLARQQDRQLDPLLDHQRGTLLKRDIRRWLIKDGWEVKVSLDGGRADHDRHRIDAQGKGSYDRIKGKLRKLVKAISKGAAPPPYSAKDQMRPASLPPMPPWGAQPGDRSCGGTVRLAAFARGNGAAGLSPLHCGLCKSSCTKPPAGTAPLAGPAAACTGSGQQRDCLRCGAQPFAVGSEGHLFPCYRFVGLEQFVLGNLDSGPSPEAVQRFTASCARPRSAREECRQCWAAPLCNGPCFATTELLSQGAPPAAYCAMMRADCEAALWLADTLRHKNPVQLCQLAGIEL